MLSSASEGANPSVFSHPGGCPGQEKYVDGIWILVKLRHEMATQFFILEGKTGLYSLWDLSGYAEVQVEHLGVSRIRRRLSLFNCNLGFSYWIPALCKLLWSQMLLAWKWFFQGLAQGETEVTDSELPKVTWGNGGNMGKKKWPNFKPYVQCVVWCCYREWDLCLSDEK